MGVSGPRNRYSVWSSMERRCLLARMSSRSSFDGTDQIWTEIQEACFSTNSGSKRLDVKSDCRHTIVRPSLGGTSNSQCPPLTCRLSDSTLAWTPPYTEWDMGDMMGYEVRESYWIYCTPHPLVLLIPAFFRVFATTRACWLAIFEDSGKNDALHNLLYWAIQDGQKRNDVGNSKILVFTNAKPLGWAQCRDDVGFKHSSERRFQTLWVSNIRTIAAGANLFAFLHATTPSWLLWCGWISIFAVLPSVSLQMSMISETWAH